MEISVQLLDERIKAVVDTVYWPWIKEELDMRVRGHLLRFVEDAKDAASKQIAQKLLEIFVKEQFSA